MDASLRKEIEDAEERLRQLRAKAKEQEWPKIVKAYLHWDKADALEAAQELLDANEFEVDRDFARNLLAPLYEVEFILEVESDGTAKIIRVNKHILGPQAE